jgi:hypothetical protein
MLSPSGRTWNKSAQLAYHRFVHAVVLLTLHQAVVPILLQGMSALVKERCGSLHFFNICVTIRSIFIAADFHTCFISILFHRELIHLDPFAALRTQ